MTAYKLLTIFVVLLLTQFAHSKPAYDDNNRSLDSSEEEIRKNPTPTQKLLLYTFDNFVALSEQFAKKAANVSRYMLKDEALIANTKPEVMEFKKNLTEFVAKYETLKSKYLTWDVLDIYTNATDYYLDMPAEKLTTDGKFILEILNKYDCKAVIASFGLEFIAFLNNFEKIFEENKSTMDKTMLEWFEKYNSLTDFEQRIDAISDFFKMA